MANITARLFIAVALFSSLACSKGFQSSDGTDLSSVRQGTPEDPPTNQPPTTVPTIPVPAPFVFEALAWEAPKPNSKPWSTYVFSLLETEAKDILSAEDMTIFCAKYPSLSDKQKINVAGQLIAGIVRYESNFNPLTRYQETTMGTDPITGEPVWSEGLMQLSYQDIQGYPFCQFDWNQDSQLSPTDPQKTILDPFKNLYCGMRILASQVKRKGRIVIDSGAYWAVIKENGRYEKIDEIAAIVSSLNICQ